MTKQGSKASGGPKKVEKRALNFYVREPEGDEPEQVAEGYFDTPRTNAWFKLDDTLNNIAGNSKTYKSYFDRLDKMIEKHPDYLDAYNYFGDTCLELADREGLPDSLPLLITAEQYYTRAFDRAKALIPPDFEGRIIWGALDNRPFLRAHHGLILCQLRRKNFAKAADLMEEHLEWNPNDNVGVRYLLGDAYLLAGDMENAKRALQKAGEEGYPDAHYSLGLLEFLGENYSAASTALRLGFSENVYIAEMLTGRSEVKSHFFWHATSHASVRQAKSYLLSLGMLELWKASHQAIDFVDWLYNCAFVMKERLESMEINEGLTSQDDFIARGIFIERANVLQKNISKTPMMVQMIKDHRTRAKRWPWERTREADFLE